MHNCIAWVPCKNVLAGIFTEFKSIHALDSRIQTVSNTEARELQTAVPNTTSVHLTHLLKKNIYFLGGVS